MALLPGSYSFYKIFKVIGSRVTTKTFQFSCMNNLTNHSCLILTLQPGTNAATQRNQKKNDITLKGRIHVTNKVIYSIIWLQMVWKLPCATFHLSKRYPLIVWSLAYSEHLCSLTCKIDERAIKQTRKWRKYIFGDAKIKLQCYYIGNE